MTPAIRLFSGKINGSVSDLLAWLDNNVGELEKEERTDQRTHYQSANYYGKNWTVHWRQYSAMWYMDVMFDDPKHATFFALKWQ